MVQQKKLMAGTEPAFSEKLKLRTFVLGIVLAGLSGCANLSMNGLFSHYSASISQTRSLVAEGDFQSALEKVPDAPAGDILDGMERGRVALLAESYPESKLAFEQADGAAVELSRKAKIQISEGLNQAGAVLSNDNLLTYIPADYELGFLHLYLTLNYLQENDLQGALVEVRRANQVQEAARKLRESELEQAAKSSKDNGVSDNVGALLSRYPDAGMKLSSVQNGYLFYLSGLLYEAEGNLNSAYIDYTRALSVAPNNQYVAIAAQRIAKKQARKSDANKLSDRYGQYETPSSDQGQVVVLSEQGVVAGRLDWRLPLWLYDSNGNPVLYNVAMPYYSSKSTAQQKAFTLSGSAVRPEEVANVTAMAKNALNEALPAMAVRQVIRLVAKNELRRAVTKEGDEVANLIANVFNTLTEQPDTRSWQTLPESVGLYSQFLASGQHTLVADGQSIEVNVKPGRTTLVWLSRQGQGVTQWQRLLGEI